jgi:hypothetical protein
MDLDAHGHLRHQQVEPLRAYALGHVPDVAQEDIPTIANLLDPNPLADDLVARLFAVVELADRPLRRERREEFTELSLGHSSSS